MDEDLLGRSRNGGGDLAFDELAAFAAGAGTGDGNKVGELTARQPAFALTTLVDGYRELTGSCADLL